MAVLVAAEGVSVKVSLGRKDEEGERLVEYSRLPDDLTLTFGFDRTGVREMHGRRRWDARREDYRAYRVPYSDERHWMVCAKVNCMLSCQHTDTNSSDLSDTNKTSAQARGTYSSATMLWPRRSKLGD